MTTVVVDTNQIVKRDWRIGSPWWSILLQLAASGQLRLVVPDLVILEAVGRFRAELGKAGGILEKLGVPIDLAAQITEYEAGLRQTLRDASAETPCDPPVTVSALVGMAIGRELPFDQNGNGFRDAVIWAYVAEFAQALEGPVVFLTGDSGFLKGSGEQAELAPALVDRLGPRSSVPSWFRDIGSFLNSLGLDRHPEVEAEVLRIITADLGQFTTNLEIAVEQAPVMVYGSESLTVLDAAPVRVHGQPRLTRTSVVEHLGYKGVYLVRFGFQAALSVFAEQELGTHSAIHSDIILPSISIEVEAFYNEIDGMLGDLTAELVEIDGVLLRDAIARQGNDWAHRSAQVPLFEEPEISMTQELWAHRNAELHAQVEEAADDWDRTAPGSSQST